MDLIRQSLHRLWPLMAMVIDTVDRSDKVIGTIEKTRALKAGVNFRVVHVFVFNREGLLLIQQIPSAKRHGGMWGSSVAGYVYSGETYEQAANRRLAEELGVTAPLQLVEKTSMKDGPSEKFIALFTTEFSNWPKLNPEEVASVEWIKIDLVQHLMETGLREFTPTFLRLAQLFKMGR